ncbi:MAG: 4Fe-4S dicluster domain-containing protein [Syntrophales bacterium]|jgi:ferredoxin|nr:4Fe-4S dicluster domain-containing protein [Syntrophales bacterium]MDY0043749.1 4Fe-4S dicluster domain-containing protein [Syntrophales bacterium]
METRIIKKENLAGIVKKLSEDMLVYAPVQEEDNVLFKVLEKGMEPLIEFDNAKNAPKNFFFPQTETMMRYLKGERGEELTDVPEEMQEAVLFGVRPCDARSFVLLDNVFNDSKYRDPYYAERREKTTIVSFACVEPPYTTCFCTSVDGHPFSTEGIDISLVDLGDEFLAEFLTPKGESLLVRLGELPKADEASMSKKEALSGEAADKIKSKVPGRSIKPWLDENFEHPFWDTIHQSCLACGTCTYLCPTCHCFDITDEIKKEEGKRIRSWDSCMYWLFTMETSGHNPRPSQKERWRQRLMHKFKYFVDNFDAIACVGCGRCVMYCPVNIDIRKIVQDISKL